MFNLLRFGLIFLLVGVLTQQLSATTLHAIVFADSYDDKIGESCYLDYEAMTAELKATARTLKLTLKPYFFTDAGFSKANAEKILKGLEIASDDIVFFYYTGHGARSPSDKTRWPQLAFEYERKKTSATFMSLAEVDEILAAKQPKFRVVLADCCNSIVPTLPSKKVSIGATRVKSAASRFEAYKKLFINPSGNVICSSSHPGQASKATEYGGAFTLVYLAILEEITKGNPEAQASWNFLLTGTEVYTQQVVGHTPQFEINIEQNPISISSGAENQIDIIMSIADQNKSRSQRVNMIDGITAQVFANQNVPVEIYGKDGHTLVDREKAYKFIRRLSTSAYLIDLVELEVQKNNSGKITQLKLHEIYRF